MLKKFVENQIDNWDKYLPYVLFAYREVPCQSTGYSPFELLYGRSIRGPFSLIKETWVGKDSLPKDVLSYVLKARRRLSQMRNIVHENIQKSQAKQKRFYDQKSSHRKFQIGDKVLVLLPTPGSKLESKWQGPYTVTNVFHNGLNYELDREKGRKQKRTYHINLLKLWKTREEISSFAPSGPLSEHLSHEHSFPSVDKEETWRDVEISSELGKIQTEKVQKLLREFSDVFSNIPSRTNTAVHSIGTGQANPIRSGPYRIPQSLIDAVDKELDQMLEMGIVRPSTSPWASPVVIVPKPDGNIRFCIDYRKLNRVTKMDAYPMPRTDQMLEKIAKAKFISTIDLTKGYWQIPLDDEAIPKSAFITARGLFELTVMPFGMKTAPATFQRMMRDKVLQGLESFADAYIDEVEVDTSTTFEEHLLHLRKVFERLCKAKLRARPKCKIAKTVVDFVGHRVGKDTIKPRDALVRTIDEFPRPETKKQVRSFLGLTGYYRRFIKNYADIAIPLTNLTKRTEPTRVRWTDVCERAFNELKSLLKSPPILRPPHWDELFILQVDASDFGVGAILCQVDNEGQEHPVVFASRKLQPREIKLSTTEKECLAIVWAVETFRYYLFGRKFILQTDHNPLVWLNQVKNKNRKLL